MIQNEQLEGYQDIPDPMVLWFSVPFFGGVCPLITTTCLFWQEPAGERCTWVQGARGGGVKPIQLYYGIIHYTEVQEAALTRFFERHPEPWREESNKQRGSLGAESKKPLVIWFIVGNGITILIFMT